MELKEVIDKARTLTRELRESLDSSNLEQWLALLERRGAAMADFERAHAAASADERGACQSDLTALKAEDEGLRMHSEALLDNLADEFRDLGSAGRPSPGYGDRDRYQACLDRKA